MFASEGPGRQEVWVQGHEGLLSSETACFLLSLKKKIIKSDLRAEKNSEPSPDPIRTRSWTTSLGFSDPLKSSVLWNGFRLIAILQRLPDSAHK